MTAQGMAAPQHTPPPWTISTRKRSATPDWTVVGFDPAIHAASACRVALARSGDKRFGLRELAAG